VRDTKQKPTKQKVQHSKIRLMPTDFRNQKMQGQNRDGTIDETFSTFVLKTAVESGQDYG